MAQANFDAATIGTFGEYATYTQDGVDTAFRATVQGRPEGLSLDVSWETLARQVEIFALADDVPTECNVRVDTITVRDVMYTVMERATTEGATYKFLCEREDVEAVSLRGRRY